ncbi:MAG: hypothetical protein JWQ46_26 [Phenylobacterium sp.]|nr:hypothetical protein [Phenylobacterium sp.]
MNDVTTRLAAAALALGLLGFAGGSAAAADKPLMAMMNGASEKPTAADPDGSGMATVRPDPAKGQVCYDISVKNIATATMAHIHKAGPDAAGPVVVPLKAPGADGKSTGCATADAAVVKDIQANPGGYYVNVHNAEYPAGAIRGQLK